MDIVGLLNDLSSSGNLMDEVFMGDDGQPTDRFLEALKFNGSRGSHTTRENVHSNSAFGSRDYASGNQKTAAAVGSAKDLEPEYVPHTQVHKTSHHGATRRASNCIQKEKDNDKSKGKGSGKGQSKDINKYKDNNKEIDKSDEKPLVVHQKPFYGTPRPSKAALVRAKDGSARAAVAEAKSQLNNSGQELAFSARQRPKKIFRSQNLTARRQALAATLLSGGASPHIPGSSLNRSSSRSRIEEKDSDEDVEMTRSEQEGEESAAAEGRARTLQLRLSGQQQALRAVEVQLVEALTLLEERSRQLAHAEGRCKAMRHELDIAQKKAQLRTLETARAVEAHRGDLLEESRARIEHLEAQLAEEVARRRRADDRGRLLKEYGERTKARGLELEVSLAEAVTASNESRAALARTRTEARELTNELTSARAALSTQEMECARQRTRAENAEYLQRNLRLDGDRLREELGQQRREMAAVQDQQQRTQAELELLRQRYAARNAEQRLLELSSVAHLPLPTPPQELRLPQQASQAVRQGGGRREADLSGQPHVSAPSASMNVLSARSNELDAEANQSVLSIPHSQEEPRRSRPHYQLPPRLSHGGDVTHTSRSKAVTAMGIKRRAQSSFLLQDSESSDDDVGGGLGGGPHRGRGVPTAGPRRSASSLEEALVTQDLGAPGADDVDTSASEGRWAAEDSAGEEETQQLRRMAEDMQAQALRAAQRADSAIRTSLDKEQLQEAIESGRDAVKTEEVAVLERYARLRNLHDKR